MIINEPEIAASALKVVTKTWGTEFWIVNCDKYCLKYLKINPGFQSSVHAHAKKDETFVGLSGTLRLNVHFANAQVHTVHAIHPGQTYRIPPETFHSFQAFNVSWVMEVSTHHDDRDVVRLTESRRLEP